MSKVIWRLSRVSLLLLCLALVLVACGTSGDQTEPEATSAETAPEEATPEEMATEEALPEEGEEGAPGAESIKIGAVIPLTGRYAAGGEQIKNGYELAVEAINNAGGVSVGGQNLPLELIILDDESDATKTVQRLETLYSSDNVVAYLGGFGSDLHAAAAAIAEKNKVPYIGVAFALWQVHQQNFQYLFSPFPKSPDLAVSIFDLLDTLDPKPTNIAIFAETTDWGAELSGLWREQAEERGYSIVADEEYAPGSQDFSPNILAAKDTEAEVVLALPNPPDGLALAAQMKELDFNANMYVFIRAADSLAWAENLGADGDYFLLMPGWNPAVNFEGVAEMVEAHQAAYGKPAQATTGPAYAAIQILADAIGRAGSLDRDAIRDAIAATDMMTVVGPVKFNPDGTGQVTTVINQWQDGTQVLIWPPDQAVGEVLYPATPWSER
ncbi:MAG: amino acid ABC transporter substrate-binding protein [Chloroflexi bacterium]|nr:amino acid ABC transporter substrate-binding protein [Chloroflexota bacterium]MCI0576305.1 amino acid ABC transporter substrate-binding protein [Chloroflexota bacterium]MCI0650026.1 amino acid ABC transporter substrate-binding protein [Chloroflexota bacterium]MCI0730490.1 amino acid ABC transporter substrate-binding protein [Chloroflexota bacterium]